MEMRGDNMTTEVDRLFPRLTYTFNRDDAVAAVAQTAEPLRWSKLAIFVPFFIGGALIGLFDEQIRRVSPINPNSLGGSLIVVGGIFMACMAAHVLITRVRLGRRARQYMLPRTDTVIDGDLRGLHVYENGTTHSYAWEALQVAVTASHVFLCRSPRDAITIPRRAFESDTAMELFVHLAAELGQQPVTPAVVISQ